MSIQPDVPLLDSLRAALKKAEADTRRETPTLAELKRIFRERIAELESTAHQLDIR
jgi:hypothetical protein